MSKALPKSIKQLQSFDRDQCYVLLYQLKIKPQRFKGNTCAAFQASGTLLEKH